MRTLTVGNVAQIDDVPLCTFNDLLAVCAVICEPVSTCNSLLYNREINREFCVSGPSEANFVARNHCAAATFYEIPYAN